jgi:hypothetical protein
MRDPEIPISGEKQRRHAVRNRITRKHFHQE